MYKIVCILFIACLFFSCDIRNKKNRSDIQVVHNETPVGPSTTVQMIDSAYDFKRVADGEKVEYSFRFRNTGKNPLIISSATASCGCTVPEKPEAPIPTGETGYLKVIFDSKGRVGTVHKDITVKSNAVPDFPVLQLLGEVVGKSN